jgi:xanthine dehydrogenase accessory factor
LGAVITEGRSETYTGEPVSIAGYKRERYSYAPANGTFHTALDVGRRVQVGDVLGRVGSHELHAQVAGIVRGITKDGIGIFQGTKVAEVDPRGQEELVSGIAERPRQIAAGVLAAIRRFH